MGEVTDLGSEGVCAAVDADLPLMLFSYFLLCFMFFVPFSSFGHVFCLVFFFNQIVRPHLKLENFQTWESC